MSKAVLDLLTLHQVIEDDSRVAELSARWDPAVPPGRVHVEIAPVVVRETPRARRAVKGEAER
jgi:Holliday junction resolvase RusA-like endonuclease